MNNNDIFKKLRVALQLRDDQIIEIVNLVNFRISKGELADIFRSEDHPNYMECGDQLFICVVLKKSLKTLEKY
jgi:uncharacterized protein YehS (DUF1456 family)